MNNNYQEEALMKKKMTFALCFCNRGFMPGELIYGARDDMVKAVTGSALRQVAQGARGPV